MATSPNYAWAEPDNSSLVKNGASDIRTLGDAVDTSVWNVGYGQAGKNKIINGNFSVNQRSFTSTTTSSTYMFDRWVCAITGNGTSTFSAQAFTAGSAPVAGYEAANFIQNITTGQTSTDVRSVLIQRIEDVRTFAGNTITASFWAKAATGTPKIAVEFAPFIGFGGTGTMSNIYAGQVTLSTSWARYSVTATMASLTGITVGTSSSINLQLWMSAGSDFNSRTGSLGIQSNTFQIWGAQVEYGSKATPFQLAGGGDPQSELAMCQRYYYRTTSSAGSQTGTGISGITNSITNLVGYFTMPVPLRVSATAIDFSNIGTQTTVSGLTAISAVTFATENTSTCAVMNFTSSGFVANTYGIVRGTSGTGYIGLSAEL